MRGPFVFATVPGVKIASWNVNSLKARLPHVLDFLGTGKPDVLLLQEIKCVDDAFPRLEIESLGYRVEVLGQKTYNGVAILSPHPIEDVTRGLPGDDSDQQARYLEATIGGVRVASIYLPNGNPVGTEKFPYKLAWMERLYAHARQLMMLDQAVVLGGDYNVCPTDIDVYDPVAFRDDALCRPESRAAFRKIVYLGWTDAFRALYPREHAYSYWDYQQNRWARDEGLRIDHLLLSPRAADRLQSCHIEKALRGRDKASDHTAIWCALSA